MCDGRLKSAQPPRPGRAAEDGGKNESRTYDSNCLSYNPSNQPIIQDTGTAHTFNAGVDIKFWIEFNLSSTTGYDQTAELQYTLPDGGYLCGTTGYPQSQAPGNLVFAGKYNVCKVHC
jgi:hypothetical protein